jgi:lysophospholipase L1-like esterase
MGLVLTLLAPMVVELVGWDDPWAVIVPSALLGALCLWNINAAYARWINDDRRWGVGNWLSVNLTFAVVGIALVAIASLAMAWSSDENVQVGIAYALGLWLAGMVPVVQVVRAELDEIADAFPATVAWVLNATLIAGATVLPAGLLTGWERSGLVFGAGAGLLWLVYEVARRLVERFPQLSWLGVVLMAGPVAAVLVVDPDVVGLRWLAPFPFGLALVSARQRSSRPVVLARRPPWPSAAAVGLVVFGAGFVVWWMVLDDVALGLVLGGALAALLFGASLVTRGEGLVVVVLLGLSMVWVVQDHTGEPAPLAAPDADAVLAAFGDSYLSGEGIGSFYADTNTAGARDLSILGTNECRRSEYAYSPMVAAARTLDLAFYGCSGALATTGGFTADDPAAVAAEAAANSVYGQLLRWEHERGTGNDPTLVLLSLGGNDAGFATIGAACFLPGSCDDALDANATPALADVTDRVADALTKARTMFPTSPMVVVAYPQMFGPDIDRCGGQVPFNGTETGALRDFVVALNVAVGAAVERVGGDQVVHFTGATAAYEGARFCELGDDGHLVEPTAIRSLAFQPTEGDDLLDRLVPAKIIHNTFHPTRRGHELMTDALLEFLAAGCHADGTGPVCDAGTAPLGAGRVLEPEEVPAERSPDEEPEGGEVVEGAPIGGCNDLDTFNQCTIIQSLRLVLAPLAAMTVAGVLLVLAARRGDLLGWVRSRLPSVGAVLELTPLRRD